MATLDRSLVFPSQNRKFDRISSPLQCLTAKLRSFQFDIESLSLRFSTNERVESREILLHLLVVIVVIVVVVVVVKPSLVRHWLLFTLFSKNYIALKVFHGEGNITFLNIKRHVHLSP